MRVIAGTLRGRTLRTVRDLSVRPTTDRAKQVIFDVLATRCDMDGARVLDIFAGSGSLGIESISRGAASVVFVERSNDAADCLEQNVRSLGIERSCEVVRGDIYRYLRSRPPAFDLVFADPPYDLEGIADLPSVIDASGALKPGGWLVMEHRSTTHVEPDPSKFAVVRKELGQTIALVMQVTTNRHSVSG
jgi:16S rRNA (guanine(966)-N(2))-methyltransferase RsmD